ncbi:MAG: hypothetical protein ABI693_23465 [Bryobacteraceae bacterium]
MGSGVMVLPKPSLGESLKLVGMPTRAQTDRPSEIAERTNELVRTIASIIDDLLSMAIEQRTSEDFKRVRAEVFPQYIAVMKAFAELARIVLPKQALDRLSAESFSELEDDFRNLGPSTFGADLTERGIFTVWILRKIWDLAQEITRSPTPLQENVAQDAEMGTEFLTRAMWTRFHVDCLTKSMRSGLPIYPEAIESIREGLRAAVNTYASVRQWADLRNPRTEPELTSVEWTNDDEQLLADSMRDLEQESA